MNLVYWFACCVTLLTWVLVCSNAKCQCQNNYNAGATENLKSLNEVEQAINGRIIRITH